MFEERDVKLDVLALGLLALTIFDGLALFSYDAADRALLSARSSVYETAAPVAELNNMCGAVGALVADGMLRLLGVGAWFAVASLAILTVCLLMRRTINQRALRLVGWVLSLVGVTTLAAILIPRLLPTFWFGPDAGPGGLLGSLGSSLILTHFATTGAYILLASFILAGMLLCTDYFIVKWGWMLVAVPVKSVAPARRAAGAHRSKHSNKSKKVQPVYDEFEEDEFEEDEEEEDDEPGEPSVRILGRRMKSVPAAEDDEYDYEDEDEDEDEDAEYEDEYEEDEYEEDEVEHDEDEFDEDEVDEDEDEPIVVPARVVRKSTGGRRVRRLASALRIKKPPTDTERDQMIASLEAASHTDNATNYELPDLDLLLEADSTDFDQHEKEVRRKAKVLEKTFGSFGFNVRVVEIETGPVIAQYEVELEAGLRLSKITGLADDLAIALRVPSVRIVAPIPGKNTVGIEVPNTERQLVRLREVMEEDVAASAKMKIPVFLGKDVAGNPMSVDLASLPHLLIAGRTGTGKSVCLNSIITSMIMTRRPDEVKMLMIDPKMVELSPYRKLPHLMHPVVTDMKKAEAILAWAVEKMEERYSLLARAGVRHVSVYNQLGEEELMDRMEPESDEDQKEIPLHLPYIVIIADEMADLMMTAAKEVEGHIIRLAQKSRAVGIHLVLATQKPTVDVITGLIKSNLPARVAFQVASRTDSRVVLDEMGADKLLGNGDMLFLWPGTSALLRGQGTYLSDDEINRVVSAVATDEPQFVNELVQLKPADSNEGKQNFKDRDELYESAIDVVVREGRGSVSLLQRALGIGYGRAARLIDFMAEDGLVGTYNGSQAREVLVTPEQWAEMSGDDAVVQTAPARRRNKITIGTADDDADQEYAEFEDSQIDSDADEEEEDEYEDEYEDDEYEDGEEAEGDSDDEAGEEGEYEDEEEEDEYEEDEYEEDEYEEDDELDDQYEAQSA